MNRPQLHSRRDVLPHVPVFSPTGNNSRGRAEARPSGMVEMNAREIDVHIEELVLHDFAPGTRWQIGDALENELRSLLAKNGLPAPWLSSPDRIDASPIPANGPTSSKISGAQIAGAICQGLVQ
jgi:hypothetical protein